MWAELLAMTEGNIYQAMWLEENLTQEWYERYAAWKEVMRERQ